MTSLSTRYPYTVTIGALIYPIDDNEGQFEWPSGRVIPECPKCQQVLTPCHDEALRRVSVRSRWHDDHRVECESCGAQWRIEARHGDQISR